MTQIHADDSEGNGSLSAISLTPARKYDETMARTFKFGVKNLLFATFWAAIWCGAFVALRRVKYLELEVGDQWPKSELLTMVLCVSPFIAIGSLMGKARHATVVALAAYVAAVLIYWVVAPRISA